MRLPVLGRSWPSCRLGLRLPCIVLKGCPSTARPRSSVTALAIPAITLKLNLRSTSSLARSESSPILVSTLPNREHSYAFMFTFATKAVAQRHITASCTQIYVSQILQGVLNTPWLSPSFLDPFNTGVGFQQNALPIVQTPGSTRHQFVILGSRCEDWSSLPLWNVSSRPLFSLR